MKKVNFGIVGPGRSCWKFSIQNSNLLAVCSIYKNQIEEIQQAWNIPYGYTDFDEMLTNICSFIIMISL